MSAGRGCSRTSQKERGFKAQIVHLILDHRPEEALSMLCAYYEVDPPRLKVGGVKGRRGSAAVYDVAKRTILVSNREFLHSPRVLLHELYHHLRSIGGRHRGNEKYAERFAAHFIACYHALHHQLENKI